MPSLGQRDTGRGLRRPRSARNGANLGTLLAASERVLQPEEGPELSALAAELHDTLLENLDLEKMHEIQEEEWKRLVEEALRSLLSSGSSKLYGDQQERLIRMVLDEVLGFGPIQALLDDAAVQEVMVNGPEQVYVESDGILSRSAVRFRDDAHVRRVAERILGIIGRRVDESSPMVDARLRDGSRVNITVPPATPRHATITIRKFRQDRLSLDDLIAVGSLDTRMAEFIGACGSMKISVLVSGGTGTGKTTFLNAISTFIPRTERIVTIEDPLELQLQQPHVVSMEARPPDMTGRHSITQGDLLRNSLRMRPDRIIVGEIRGAEAFDMLQAMNTGHEGSLSTVHANSPRDALARVENMVLMAGLDLPVRAIREQIASALHLIIQLERSADGVRRVIKMTEVTGMEAERVTLQDIYYFEARGRTEDGAILGQFRPTGLRPTFGEQMALQGRPLGPELFLEGAAA